MILEKITLRHFRNLTRIEFQPHARINWLLGKNGQGKSSVLEAIGYLSSLRSFRHAGHEEVLSHRDPEAEVSCVLSSGGQDSWTTELAVQLVKTDSGRVQRRAFINGKLVPSGTDYLLHKVKAVPYAPAMGFHSVVLDPTHHELIRGEPSLRRTYLDQVVAAEQGSYLQGLQRFQKLHLQRNALLKQVAEMQGRVDEAYLAVLTDQWMDEACKLVHERMKWLDRLQLEVPVFLNAIAKDQRPLSVIYRSSWQSVKQNSFKNNNDLIEVHFSGQGQVPSIQTLKAELSEALRCVQARERYLGRALVGPQRDDWGFGVLGAQGTRTSLASVGSQGEVRSTLIALKLGEIKLYRQTSGLRPLLLLDDFSSELDQERRETLLRLLGDTDMQVFVTATEMGLNDVNGQAHQVFWLLKGELASELKNGR